MKEDISRKLELFKSGYIKEDEQLITYDPTLHDSCYSLLSGYWSTDLQIAYESITSNDLSGVILYKETFDVDDSTFNITSADLNIDFATEYGITGASEIQDLNDSIFRATTGFTTLITSAINSITGSIVEESKSIGYTDLLNIIISYLDDNDVYQYYKDNLTILLNTNSPDLGLTRTELDSLKSTILAHINNIVFNLKAIRIPDSINNNIMYSKLDNIYIENIVRDEILNANDSISNIVASSYGKALNNLMPTNIYIYNNTDQNQLLETTKVIIEDIDIIIKVAKGKGLI